MELYGHFFADTFHKNAKMFTKWVAVARKSLLTAAFCIIFRDTADGGVFGQKLKNIRKIGKNDFSRVVKNRGFERNERHREAGLEK